jgi:hypothetical protein
VYNNVSIAATAAYTRPVTHHINTPCHTAHRSDSVGRVSASRHEHGQTRAQ